MTLEQIDELLRLNEEQQDWILKASCWDNFPQSLLLDLKSMVQHRKELEKKRKEELDDLRIEVRKQIQQNGHEFMESIPAPLRWIAGELEYGNENRVMLEMQNIGGMSIGSETILKTGFTQNQKLLLERVIKGLTK